MIEVDQALEIIDEHSSPAAPRDVALHEAGGLVLASNLYAPLDIPAFPQSSMDGYAFSFAGWDRTKALTLAGEVAAGSNESAVVRPWQAVRIFTGAAVPPGADTVVVQEKSKPSGGELLVEDDHIVQGQHVRLPGSEIRKNALALASGTLLTPAAIGFLAGMGFSELPVFPRPVISIIVTGNELQTPGQPLLYGQVYEANSFSLGAALEQYGIRQPIRYRTGDQLDALSRLLADALEKSDVVLLTGGVSVGDYDFTARAAKQCGITTLFHKVKQKPGKPVFFGRKGKKLVFGLPGNPASVLTCFYLYVAPALERFSQRQPLVKKATAPSGTVIKKPAGLTWFLKGSYHNGVASVLDAQESYRLSSFARANCLLRLEEEQTSCNPGDPVTIYLLP